MSLITNLDDLFDGKTSFNEDIREWDVSSVTSMRDTFLSKLCYAVLCFDDVFLFWGLEVRLTQ